MSRGPMKGVKNLVLNKTQISNYETFIRLPLVVTNFQFTLYRMYLNSAL